MVTALPVFVVAVVRYPDFARLPVRQHVPVTRQLTAVVQVHRLRVAIITTIANVAVTVRIAIRYVRRAVAVPASVAVEALCVRPVVWAVVPAVRV